MENRIVLGLNELFEDLIEDKKALDIKEKLLKAAESFEDEGKSRLSIPEDKIKYFEAKTDVPEVDQEDERIEFEVYGGLNGPGEWEDYFKHLGELFAKIHAETGWNPRVKDLNNDMLDDVFYVTANLFSVPEETKTESLKEDLIVIEPEEAKIKLDALVDQIEKCDDEAIKKSLITLLNIYLFQTLSDADNQEESGCTISRDDWEEYNNIQKRLSAELQEALFEAKLDYGEQTTKMQQLENGTRGFNGSTASPEKLRMNQQICIKNGWWKALYTVETFMLQKGLITQRTSPGTGNTTNKQQNAPQVTSASAVAAEPLVTLTAEDFTLQDAAKIKMHSSAENLWTAAKTENPSSFEKKIIVLIIWAVVFKDPTLANELKLLLQESSSQYTNEEIRKIIKNCTSAPAIMAAINEVLASLTESLKKPLECDEIEETTED